MLNFTKLRLVGFKSFVDPTELLIQPGMTGIVGPNGCGKSNLVEALRWVMGETSPKQVRGSGMDDVIFNGTSDRPPRNVSEVALALDNSSRTAPSQFNEFEELEVSRRIERGEGSLYRVNGRDVRARDVQLLFADTASGARSTALVSQGKVGAVIAAKPTERRHLLEEAAGITGLHSRRHEAELRLKAAETNITRLDDVLVTLEAQLQTLRKQARQATRYRNLSGHIRRAEGALFLLRWLGTMEDAAAAATLLTEIEREVAEATGSAAHAAEQQASAAALLPDARKAEAAAAAELHRLTLARDALDAEARQVATAKADCAERIVQAETDSAREQVLFEDATAARKQLGEEYDILERARGQEAQQRAAAEQALAQAQSAADGTDRELAQMTDLAAAEEARRIQLGKRARELTERGQRLDVRRQETAARRATLEVGAADHDALNAADAAAADARAQLADARGRQDASERRRRQTEDAERAALGARHEARSQLGGLEAEARALGDVLGPAEAELFPPLIDSVTVAPGFEAALAAALGEDLSAPADELAPVHWRTLPPLAESMSMPAGCRPLGDVVRGPAALGRRIRQTGLVDDDATGRRLQGALAPGQRLVSRAGALWRWDGFTIAAGASTAAAKRLEARNRLTAMQSEIAAARDACARADEAVHAAERARGEATEAERAARETAKTAEAAEAEVREWLAGIKEETARRTSQLQALADAANGLALDVEENTADLAETERALTEMADPAEARAAISLLRKRLTDERARQMALQAERDGLIREAESRARRITEIGREIQSWQVRGDSAGKRIDELRQRLLGLAEERARLALLPAQIEARRASLLDAIEQSETRRKEQADRLAETESRAQDAQRALRAAEIRLAEVREERVRRQGAVERVVQASADLRERIRERLDAGPDDLRAIAELGPDEPLPVLDATESRLERLLRERDTMGPVNLRAEQEAEEMGQQIEGLQTERDDLVKAIEKLRQAINELNREGRERLLASFRDVDTHFQALFTRLFGGGLAHLQLTDSDDPLEAGLEIMASPPGKRMQNLALLSGGEQALTSIALLFAVFLTNPAPICVLDEVDSPLDDANVGRFCDLVDEIAHSSATRFLVVTHHRLTMARMDRLFGVTMPERGVSQLVSVDLQRVGQLRAAE